MSDAVYSLAEVEKICGCTEETLVQRIERGELAALKLGRGWIFPREAFDRSLNELAMEEARRRRHRPVAGAPQAPVTGRRRSPPPLPATSYPPGPPP